MNNFTNYSHENQIRSLRSNKNLLNVDYYEVNLSIETQKYGTFFLKNYILNVFGIVLY